MPFVSKRIPILITLLFIHFSSLFAQHETEYDMHHGYELHFDGDDDYVNINTVADDMNGLTDWAFSLWVKPQKDLFQATNVYYLAINCENGNANCNRILFGIRTEDGKPFIWERPDGGGSEGFVLTSETAINDGKWNHIAYSSAASTGTLYLNGESVGTHTVKHAAFKSDDRWSLGQEFDGNSITNEYVGSIDDVAVYNRAKSSEYFAGIYNSGIGNIANHASANGLTSYWKIDEGKGTTIGDQMSAGNTGTIVGATWKTTRAKTIDNLKVTEFDVYRDRLYAVHPGTNDASDSAAVVSIVDIRTDSVIAQGGEFSTTKPGFHGYPNKIAVFDHIGVVGEDLKMFDFRQDSVKYMCRNLYSTEADCDSYNYLSHNALHMQRHRDHLYIALHSYGFAVFDMSDPLRPVKVHEKDYGLENDYPYGIHANDTHIFVADIDTDGGKVYIHKNGGDFEKIGEVNTKAYRLATHSNFLYTDQKKVFDISDPTSPQELTNHNYTGSSSNGEMSVYGDYLLIAAGGYKDSGNPRASIYDIKDPTDVKLAYTFNDTLPSYDIKISGKKLFVAFEAQGTDVGRVKVFNNQFVPQKEVYVSTDGNDETGNGSYINPYKTIEKAISVTSIKYNTSNQPRYEEFNAGDKKFHNDRGFCYSSGCDYAVSAPILVMEGTYRITNVRFGSNYYNTGNDFFQKEHVQSIRSISGPDKTFLKPAWKSYATENGVNISKEGIDASDNGYLELHGFNIDSLRFGTHHGTLLVYNSIVQNVNTDGSGTWYAIKYYRSTLNNVELDKGNGTHIHSSVIYNPRQKLNSPIIKMAYTLYDTLLVGESNDVAADFSKDGPIGNYDENWVLGNIGYTLGGNNDPQFCDSTTFRYYDTSPATNAFGDRQVGRGVGCDKPKPFDWVTDAMSAINIDQENVNDEFILEWTESKNNYGYLYYEILAKVGIYPYETIDMIKEEEGTSYEISYQDFLENVFQNTPGNGATVGFSVYAIDGPDTVKVTGDDRMVHVNRYDYLSTESEGIPNEFALHENYPNPFNPSTQIRFDLPEMSNVNLTIYNMLGQKVKTYIMQTAPAGYHSLTWNATNDLGVPVSAGVYLYQLQTDGFNKTKKMVLLK